MRTESKDLVSVNSIVQVTADGSDHRWRLMIVAKVETWGVLAYQSHEAGMHRFSWESIEPTGGMVQFYADGKRVEGVAPVETKVRHHP